MSNSKVIVITGASSGIGKATAQFLAKDGHKIVLAARRKELLEKLVSEVESLGGKAVYQVTDVTKVDEVENLAKLAIDTFGKIDVWLNNAGIMPQSLLQKKLIKDWDETIDINIKGVLYGIGAALPYMVKKNSGQFINISSVAGHFAHAGGAVYSASKWAVRAISESLRDEMAQSELNIRVTVISPGAIHTNLLSSVTDKEMKAGFEDFYNTYAIPVERVALSIKQAIDLPEDSAWNEVIIRPTKQRV
ncbi:MULTISPECIES: SDR family oxidoreductase [Gemella]|uniref:SDR family oxidoreductase n=1 Tax=Gemella TaxID=1378 RepID=UPI0007684368|nr:MULTISPECIES: SDR family oxidoreductase [Gemella]AME09367.1 oxidoreductase [Gemella sp. oral taxon 928]AXI27003.1 NAD(P)-dependent oxidoreductase [Gemella sp. ND 6198]